MLRENFTFGLILLAPHRMCWVTLLRAFGVFQGVWGNSKHTNTCPAAVFVLEKSSCFLRHWWPLGVRFVLGILILGQHFCCLTTDSHTTKAYSWVSIIQTDFGIHTLIEQFLACGTNLRQEAVKKEYVRKMRSATETFISNEMSVTKLGETQWTTYLINRMTF